MASAHDHRPPASPLSAEAQRAHLQDLAARASTGDRAAFDALAHALRPTCIRLFLDRGAGPTQADDLAQLVASGLWKALSTGRYDASRAAITTFAYAVSLKVWLQHLRASGRRDAALERYARLVAQPASTGQSEATSPDDAHHAARVLEALRAALRDDQSAMASQLTDEERWLLRCWAGGQSDRQLAARLGIAASNVNARKQRAYAKLRTYLIQLGLAQQDPPPPSHRSA